MRLTTTVKLSARGAALLAPMVEHLPAEAEAHVADRSALEAVRLRLRALAETMPASDRDLYRVMFAKEKSFTEAAAALGIDRSKVQRNVEGLKRRLADRLAEAA